MGDNEKGYLCLSNYITVSLLFNFTLLKRALKMILTREGGDIGLFITLDPKISFFI